MPLCTFQQNAEKTLRHNYSAGCHGNLLLLGNQRSARVARRQIQTPGHLVTMETAMEQLLPCGQHPATERPLGG